MDSCLSLLPLPDNLHVDSVTHDHDPYIQYDVEVKCSDDLIFLNVLKWIPNVEQGLYEYMQGCILGVFEFVEVCVFEICIS